MKVIKKTLAASALALAVVNHAQAEMDPLSYGVKVAFSNSSFSADSDAKLSGKAVASPSLGNPFASGHLYAEYAFNDYIGLGLAAGYMNQGGKLVAKADSSASSGDKDKENKNKDESSIKMTSHGIHVPLYLCVYPLGREEDNGILKLFVGGFAYLPLSTHIEQKGADGKADANVTGDKIKEDANKKKELPGFDAGAHVGLGYEFPFGLAIESNYGYGFINRFGEKDKDKEQSIFQKTVGLKKLNTHNFNLGISYNLAAAFCD